MTIRLLTMGQLQGANISQLLPEVCKVSSEFAGEKPAPEDPLLNGLITENIARVEVTRAAVRRARDLGTMVLRQSMMEARLHFRLSLLLVISDK